MVAISGLYKDPLQLNRIKSNSSIIKRFILLSAFVYQTEVGGRLHSFALHSSDAVRLRRRVVNAVADKKL